MSGCHFVYKSSGNVFLFRARSVDNISLGNYTVISKKNRYIAGYAKHFSHRRSGCRSSLKKQLYLLPFRSHFRRAPTEVSPSGAANEYVTPLFSNLAKDLHEHTQFPHQMCLCRFFAGRKEESGRDISGRICTGSVHNNMETRHNNREIIFWQKKAGSDPKIKKYLNDS